MRNEDAQITAVIDALVTADADVVALQGFDYDLENRALRALADGLAQAGLTYPHLFAAPPNAGLQTSQDLDGDGRFNGPGDAQGYGYFFGQGGMAVLSRYPVQADKMRDHSAFLWHDLPGAMLPFRNDAPFPSAQAQKVQRLAAHGFWQVPVEHPRFGQIDLLIYHASPPVFDGPEDRNGRRNHDETRFWALYLEGALSKQLGPQPTRKFVLLGDANLDPDRGDGRQVAMQTLLAMPVLQDPLPGLATVDWPQTGPMRVDYVLPSADWMVVDAGVLPRDPAASRHSLVWVDLKP